MKCCDARWIAVTKFSLVLLPVSQQSVSKAAALSTALVKHQGTAGKIQFHVFNNHPSFKNLRMGTILGSMAQ